MKKEKTALFKLKKRAAAALLLAALVALAGCTPNERKETGTETENPLTSSFPDESGAETKTPSSVLRLSKELVMPENAQEIYTCEEADISLYLGSSKDRLFFLGSGAENPETHRSNKYMLSAERSEKGGKISILADLGFISDLDYVAMIDDRFYLDIMNSSNGGAIPAGGALVSVSTGGEIQVLKEYHHQPPLVSVFGQKILYSALPKEGESGQRVEAYDARKGEWSDLFSLELLREASQDQTESLLTGTMLYRFGGITDEGFWYAAKAFQSEPVNKEGVDSILWYYDIQSGEHIQVGMSKENVSVISGDRETGFFKTPAGSAYLLYSSGEARGKQVVLPTPAPLKAWAQTTEDGSWLLHSSNNKAALLFDRSKNELVSYSASEQGWDVQTSFLSAETPNLVCVLLRETPEEGQKDISPRKQKIAVLPAQ